MNVHKFDGTLGWIVEAYRQKHETVEASLAQVLLLLTKRVKHPSARKVGLRLITDAHEHPVTFGVTGYKTMTLLELFFAVLTRVHDATLVADVLVEMKSGMCLEGRVNRLLQLLATTL